MAIIALIAAMALMAVMTPMTLMFELAKLATRARTTVMAIMSEKSNYCRYGSNAQSNCDSFKIYEFCYIRCINHNCCYEYGHNDCDCLNN